MDNIEVWKIYFESKLPKTYKKYVLWEVSNYGRVKRNHILYDCRLHNGYPSFSGWFVHRAVAELFIPNPENKPCVDHIDTNPLNNHISNLRWVTNKENSNNPLTIKHMKEYVFTDEHRNNIRKSLKDKPQPEYRKKLISDTLKGRTSPIKDKHRVYNEDGSYCYEK